jgi:hypothetical protein
MKEILRIIPAILYIIVGIICLSMAVKSLTAGKYLPFHEAAAGKPWEKLDKPLQYAILAILRISGLGFLAAAILLIVFPAVNYFRPDIFIEYSAPAIALIFCSGLFLFNYQLYKKTKADTPWQGSIAAMLIISLGIIISIIQKII